MGKGEGVAGMEQVVNAGLVVFEVEYNALPIIAGAIMVMAGLLCLALVYAGSGADFNKADGAGMEGPAPSPIDEQLPEWMPGDEWEEGKAWDGTWDSPPCRQLDKPDIQDNSLEFEEAMQKVAEVANEIPFVTAKDAEALFEHEGKIQSGGVIPYGLLSNSNWRFTHDPPPSVLTNERYEQLKKSLESITRGIWPVYVPREYGSMARQIIERSNADAERLVFESLLHCSKSGASTTIVSKDEQHSEEIFQKLKDAIITQSPYKVPLDVMFSIRKPFIMANVTNEGEENGHARGAGGDGTISQAVEGAAEENEDDAAGDG